MRQFKFPVTTKEECCQYIMHLVEWGSTFTLMHGLWYIASFLFYVPKSYVCTLTYCTCMLVSIMWQWQYTLRDLFLCDLHILTLVYSNFVVSHKSLIVPSNLLALNESHSAVHALIASNLQMSLYILIMKIYQGVEMYNLYLLLSSL